MEKLNSELSKCVLLMRLKLDTPYFSNQRADLSGLQMCALALLAREEELTMTELATKLSLPKQQMTQIVHRLAEHSYVERTADENDRRHVLISLTDKGRDYYAQTNNVLISNIMQRIKKLSCREIKQFSNAISTLNKILPQLDYEE